MGIYHVFHEKQRWLSLENSFTFVEKELQNHNIKLSESKKNQKSSTRDIVDLRKELKNTISNFFANTNQMERSRNAF